jgi:hypothetical protein
VVTRTTWHDQTDTPLRVERMPLSSVRRRFAGAARDTIALSGVALAGLAAWFAYVAVQPRDYARPFGSPDRLETLFGWRAPAIDPLDFVERDRIYLALVGWLVVGVVAGRLRPQLSAYVGPAAVLPTLLVFFSTAPHDAQGWWTFNAAFLPVAAGLASGAAYLAPNLDWLFRRPALFGCALGALVGAALLIGGGESAAVVVGVAVGSAALGAAGRPHRVQADLRGG